MTLDVENKDANIKNFLILADLYIKNIPSTNTLSVGEFLRDMKTGFETHPEITVEYTYGWLEKINGVLYLHQNSPSNVSLCELLHLLPSSYSPNWFNTVSAHITGTLTI